MEPIDPTRVQFEMVLAQYRAVLDQSNALARRMEQAALQGYLLLALAAALVFGLRQELPPVLAWLAPLIFLIVFAAWIGLAAQQVAAAWQARILSAELAHLGMASAQQEDIPSLLWRLVGRSPAGGEHPGNGLPSEETLNLWRGEWKLRLLVLAPAVLFAGLFGVVLYLGGRTIYHASPVQGLGFGLLYLLMAAVELAALRGIMHDLPRHYAALHRAAQQGEPHPGTGGFETRATVMDGLRGLAGRLLPLPAELRWSWAFWAGVLSVPLLGLGLASGRLDSLNALFRNDRLWETASSVPLTAVLALSVIWFVAAELLLQQAAAIWHTHGRTPPAGALVRWALALLPAWWLGGEPLLALFVVISVYTVLDVLLIRPRGVRFPALALLAASAGLPLRFLVGVLVWGVAAWALAVYQALAVAVFFVTLALLTQAKIWRRAGLLAAWLTMAVVLVFQVLADGCAFAPGSFLAGLYAACERGKVVYASTGLANGLLVVFDLLFFLLLIGLLLAMLPDVLRLGERLPLWKLLRPLLAGLFLLLALAGFILAFLAPGASWAILGALLGITGLMSAGR